MSSDPPSSSPDQACAHSICRSPITSPTMRVLFLAFLITAFTRTTLTAAVGTSFLKAAFAISEYKARVVEDASNANLPRTSRQTDFDSIPICVPSTGQAALERWESCGGCHDQVSLVDIGIDPDFIEDTCPTGCCGEYNLDAIATGHFIHCKGGCCSRLVSLQISDLSTPEQVQLALELQVIVNNEYTVSQPMPLFEVQGVAPLGTRLLLT